MNYQAGTRVEVAVDVLDTEALYAESVAKALRVIQTALKHSPSEIREDISGTCWLLEQIMYMHEDTLRAAARGNLNGKPLDVDGGPGAGTQR